MKKNRLNEFIQIYSIIFLGSTFALTLSHILFNLRTVHVNNLLGLMVISLVISSTRIILLGSNSTFRPKRMLIHSIVHFFIVLSSILLASWLLQWTESNEQQIILILVTSITYILVWLIFYFRDYSDSKLINKHLQIYKEKKGGYND